MVRLKTNLVAGFATVLVLLPVMSSAASAACLQWDVSGNWRILQSNGAVTNISIVQTGTQLVGNGSYTTRATSSRFGSKESGQLDGTLRGNAVNFSIFWSSSSVGAYTGTIGPTGRIEGSTFDKRNPASRAAWHSSARMKCVRSR